VLGAVIGFQSAQPLLALVLVEGWPRLGGQFAAGLVVGIVGRLSAPPLWGLFVRGMSRVLAWLGRMPLRDFLVGLFGLTVGLLIASAVGYLVSGIPGIGGYLRLGALVVFGYLGLQFALLRREELAGMFDRGGRRARSAPKVLDTSAIIDGRIADVVQAGFLEGALLVPRSVLRELQAISDSTDPRRRARGRRGLDVLNRLQAESQLLQIVEDEGAGEVDERIVELARANRAGIVTTDFNLNRVAQLQGVRVLNINDLSSALRPVVLPGEELRVHVTREGKEAGQGVGYLEDGTMVVVEGGRNLIGTEIEVVATSVLQTAAGRMVFVRPKHDPAARRSTG
jgi:uncharacterized protein YacL